MGWGGLRASSTYSAPIFLWLLPTPSGAQNQRQKGDRRRGERGGVRVRRGETYLELIGLHIKDLHLNKRDKQYLDNIGTIHLDHTRNRVNYSIENSPVKI